MLVRGYYLHNLWCLKLDPKGAALQDVSLNENPTLNGSNDRNFYFTIAR
jgi:hypothetical protein